MSYEVRDLTLVHLVHSSCIDSRICIVIMKGGKELVMIDFSLSLGLFAKIVNF